MTDTERVEKALAELGRNFREGLRELKSDVGVDMTRVEQKVDALFAGQDDVRRTCAETRVCNARKFGTIWERLRLHDWLIGLIVAGLISGAIALVFAR